MPLISWIKGHQVLVGTIIICILLVVGSIVTFLVIRSIKRRLRLKGRLGVFSILKKKVEEVNMKTKKVKPIRQEVGQSAVVSPLAAGPTTVVDANQLSVAELEQLLVEKKNAVVVQSKQATLMAMSKEELVQLIIDNQIEI